MSPQEPTRGGRRYDLIVVGAGSGNMLFGPELATWHSAIIEKDRFGGTCLNRGCIPSKMLVVAADAVQAARHAERLGVHTKLSRVDWPAIRDRVFGRIDPLHERAVAYRQRHGVDVFTAPARFVAPKVLDVDGERLTGEHIVVAAGSRPVIPAIPGLDRVAFHTSDTIMVAPTSTLRSVSSTSLMKPSLPVLWIQPRAVEAT